MLSPQNDTNEVITETLEELTTDHKEAVTLLMLLTKYVSTDFPSIIIMTSDIKVFFFALLNSSSDLYVSICTS